VSEEGQPPAVDPMVDETGRRPLWTCPECGHRFVSPNMSHSCFRGNLDTLFARSEPQVRQAFARFVALIERCGPIVVIPQKSRITIMVRVRFAGCEVRRDRLIAGIALSRRVEHARWLRIEDYGPRWQVHRFELRRPEDLDDPELVALFCESYRDLGEQGSLGR
jgi:hypothetical protein